MKTSTFANALVRETDGDMAMQTGLRTWTPTVSNCDQYMDDRQGKYEYRAIRYRAAIEWMLANGLKDGMTVIDVGAGMTEFMYCMVKEFNLSVRYIPVDGGIDGTDLNNWTPPRSAHFVVGLEILEHLTNWKNTLDKMKECATVGVVVSTPNPIVTDVLAMDPTHVREIFHDDLVVAGMKVARHKFYGGVFNRPNYTDFDDALLGTWRK